jgi:hypothetical protein
MGEAISFAPRKAIKSQVLADFVAEWVDTQLPTVPIQPELWTMFFDGLLMKTGAGAGLLFISPLGKHLRYVLRLHFPASNNVAEYEALVNGLRIAIELGVRRLDARDNSQLVRHPPAMHFHHRRPGAPTRDTLGGLRPSRSTPDPCWKRLPTRFLLADDGGRRH